MKPLADPPIPMPTRHFVYVSHIRMDTKMSFKEFNDFECSIRQEANNFLDATGLVKIEDQDPAALKSFRERILNLHPSLNQRYVDAWPILAYLDVYLYNRRRSGKLRSGSRDQWVTPARSTTRQCSVPIWIRYAHHIKTGESLKEILPQMGKRKLRRGKPRRPARKRRETVVEDSGECKMLMKELVTRETKLPVEVAAPSGGLLDSLWPSFGNFLSGLFTG